MKSKHIILGLFVLMSFPIMAQTVDTLNPIKSVDKNVLTYIWTGRYCPCAKPAIINQYGFKIVCAGCILTKKIIRHNRRVVRKLNRKHGKGWFDAHKNSFCFNKKRSVHPRLFQTSAWAC